MFYFSFILIQKNRRRVKLQTFQFYIYSKTIKLQRVKSVIIFAKMVSYSRRRTHPPARRAALIFTGSSMPPEMLPQYTPLHLRRREHRSPSHKPSILLLLAFASVSICLIGPSGILVNSFGSSSSLFRKLNTPKLFAISSELVRQPE